MEWRDIAGCAGKHQVSDTGLVRNTRTGRVLSQAKSSGGYPVVNLTRNGIRRVARVHRLVAEAFIPRDGSRLVVNHKDGCKTNNTVDNLEWCTSGANNYHSCYVLGSKLGKPMRPVISINLKTGVERMFPSLNEAARQLGCYATAIRKVINGEMSKHSGYTFKEPTVAARNGMKVELRMTPF